MEIPYGNNETREQWLKRIADAKAKKQLKKHRETCAKNRQKRKSKGK